jgi:hypothetical protein
VRSMHRFAISFSLLPAAALLSLLALLRPARS